MCLIRRWTSQDGKFRSINCAYTGCFLSDNNFEKLIIRKPQGIFFSSKFHIIRKRWGFDKLGFYKMSACALKLFNEPLYDNHYLRIQRFDFKNNDIN